jgi:iron uptake system component EfeO
MNRYESYLNENAELLGSWTAKLRGQIVAGELPRAQSRYSTSRVQYSQIEPVAQSFEDLDRRINAHSGDLPAAELGGFHRIEKALFAEETTAGVVAAAKALLADVEKLQREMKTTVLRPGQVTSDVEAMLDELIASKVAGEEEPYSHLDFVDISANVEGAEAGFEAVKPFMSPQLARRIQDRFDAIYLSLESFGLPARVPQTRARSAGGQFVRYELTPEERRDFAIPIEELAKLFSQVPEG